MYIVQNWALQLESCFSYIIYCHLKIYIFIIPQLAPTPCMIFSVQFVYTKAMWQWTVEDYSRYSATGTALCIIVYIANLNTVQLPLSTNRKQTGSTFTLITCYFLVLKDRKLSLPLNVSNVLLRWRGVGSHLADILNQTSAVAAVVGMAVLLPIFHRLDTNPNYIIIMAAITGIGTSLIKAFTSQVHASK